MSQNPAATSDEPSAPPQWRTLKRAAHQDLPGGGLTTTAVTDTARPTGNEIPAHRAPNLIQQLAWTATSATASAAGADGRPGVSSIAAPLVRPHPAQATEHAAADGSSAARPKSGSFPDPGALTHQSLVRRRPERPTAGWRAAVFALTAGAVNPGPSSQEAARRRQRTRIRAELAAPHIVVVLSLKGGVGKTTVTALLGQMLAVLRGDQVVAFDANPDAGTLADRILGRSAQVTVRDLVDDLATIRDATDLARYTGLAGRLHVLASEHDPALSEAFNRQDCEQTIALLRRFFHVVVIDSGTGVTHAAIGAALDAAQSLVVVGAPTVDGASRASKTLDWLQVHGYADLAADAVMALPADRSSPDVDPEVVRELFAARCRAVVPIPRDPHLATGGLVDLDLLRPATYAAALALSSAVADQFQDHTPSS